MSMAARKTASTKQESRIGKKQLPVWVAEETHFQLKGLAHEQGRTIEAIVVELVEAYLRKHGKLKR